MVFKIDFFRGNAVLWSKTDDGVRRKIDRDYRPRIYIDGTRNDLHKARSWIAGKDGVAATCLEEWKTDLSQNSPGKVLRVDISSEEKVMKVVSSLKKNFRRGRFRFYHVSLRPQFRYCLQEKINPRPDVELERTDLNLPRHRLAKEKLEGLEMDGEEFKGSNSKVLREFMRRFRDRDPDLVTVNRGQVLELINKELQDKGYNRGLGRVKGFEKLAGENTVSSYGKTVHSSARYNIPGRIIIDRSNSFMLGETTVEGLWDLVDRSWKPLQELAWGSIGNLLTAIEVRKAYHEKNVLTPWKNWEGEKPKKASTLHKADRGGFIFNPEPTMHEDVYEVDFASMYPNIMITRNISPETVCCDCCENSKVPELGFSICQEDGFIPEVLDPLVTDRRDYKKERDAGIQDPEREKYVEGAIDAIKWLLVTCFGYMGHAHASYGAIECHQAINAYARKIMRESKEIFEENGWEVKHGIIDSIWVSKREKDATELQEVCREVSDHVGIDLEFEHEFEWVSFVPRAGSDAKIGTLNRYFGKKKSGGFKTAGIEVEQSSTCKFVRDTQQEMIEAFDRDRNPGDVYKVLRNAFNKLENMDVDFDDLVIQKKTTKPLEAYSVENRTVAALKRAQYHGIEYRPGQTVKYVVVNDRQDGMGRVRLDFEEVKDYDINHYKTLLVRAAESILSPVGIDREQIRGEMYGKNSKIKKFTGN
ncbi:MAG: type B DNA-directed DNA polymerase [Candidatus Nanosalina sp.]